MILSWAYVGRVVICLGGAETLTAALSPSYPVLEADVETTDDDDQGNEDRRK